MGACGNSVDDAAKKGARVIELAGGASESARKFAPTLVLGVDEGMRIMQEEIMGPVLPVKTYRTIEEALGYLAGRPRPLALYYFDHDPARIQRVLAESLSGGVTINDTIFHIAQDALPFGGVGASGMGHYHGEDGFNTFSKRKGVFLQSRLSGVEPPSPAVWQDRRGAPQAHGALTLPNGGQAPATVAQFDRAGPGSGCSGAHWSSLGLPMP